MAHGGTQNAVASVPPSSEQRENNTQNSSGSGTGAGTNNANSANSNSSNSTSNNSMNNFCSACGVQFESSASLQVHIQNHHNQPVTAAADSSDNQPPTPQSTASASASSSSAPGGGAITGATTPTNGGDPTTTPNHQQTLNSYNRVDYSSANQLPNYHHHHHSHHHHQQQHQQPASEMHYPSYMSNYDQYYHQHSMEYGLPPPPPIPTHYLNNLAAAAAGDYKVVPSSNRFHPYGGISNNLTHPYGSAAAAAAHHQQQQHHQQNGSALATAAAISAAAAAQSSMSSPSIVTSSSPIQNNLMNSTTLVPSSIGGAQTPSAISGQPTPSPSPRQCDKCGVVCETVTALSEHQVQAHNATPNDAVINRGGDLENDIPSFHYSNFGHHHHPHHNSHSHHHQHKDEPTHNQPPDCDILDLDSQKMVYPPHEMQQQQQQQQAPLPPMHSLHPMQRPMMWPPHGPPIPPPHDSNSFLPIPPQTDLKAAMFGSIKTEFSPQIIKQESGGGGHHLTQLPTTPTNPTQSDISKSFGSGGSDGSQTSPSEFPSTTTPQDNGPQFRTFEAATSSLQNGGPIIKATSWKSNEARRPKTYNCTACNKWFTSSGHLKRHYNTTLHKNAVKTSGQPDPATLPISAHHHPARDPHSKHNRYNNNKTTHNNNSIVQHQSQAQIQSATAAAGLHQQQQQLSNSESSRTPDFATQFSPFATGNGGGGGGGGVTGGGGPQSQQQQSAAAMGFQYTANASIHQSSNVSNHPLNAQAGLCGPASQPRDLLVYSDITGVQQSSNNSSSSNSNSQHLQLVPDFIQVPQMQQIIPAESIITTMPPQSMVTSMSMDHHYNITTPITINTSITQSYPLMLARPVPAVAEDTNFIIGNPNHHHSNGTMVMMMHTGNSNDSNGTTPHSYYGQTEYDEPYDSGYPQMSSNCSSISNSSCISAMSSDDDKLTKYSATTIPTIAALRRLNHDIHHADTVPPFSPDIPDKRCSGNQTAMQQPYGMTRSLTPQTGETVPTNLSPNAPHPQQQQQHPHHHNQQHHFMTVADVMIKSELSEDAISVNEPSSPSITSTNTSIGFEHYTQNQHHQQQSHQQHLQHQQQPQNGTTTKNPRGGGKANKRRTAAETAKLITDTIPPGSDPLRCDPCDKVFNKACYLTQHNRCFHSGEKPYKCLRCGKRFPCEASHTKHMAKHVTQNKPYKCSQCVKQFNHKTDLRRHMCLHTGTKPYVCETCNKGFIRKDHMVKHKLTHTKRGKNGDATIANSAPPSSGIKNKRNENDDIEDEDDDDDQHSMMTVKQMGEFEPAAKRRKSVLVKNEMFKSLSSPTSSSSPSPPPPIKYHRSNLNSSNELLKLKTVSHLDDHNNDESIENKENVNTDVISIE